MNPICLVCMPMASAERPSMALGLLKAELAQGGIAARVCHANLWFLDFAGLSDFSLLSLSRPEEGLVDWVFADLVFPGRGGPADEFLDRFGAANPSLVQMSGPNWRRGLLTLRAMAADFIDWTADQVLAHEPRIVGCTSTFQQHLASIALLKRIRERAPEVVTMMGGANCETVMGRATHREFPWVDYVCSGEADEVIVPLVEAALRDGREITPENAPPGIFAPFHRESGYPAIDGGDGVPRNSVGAMTALPMPDFDDYFEDLENCLWKDFVIPGLPIETSRGCWWGQVSHCTFCGLNGGNMNFRSKTPDQVIDEIDALVARHGITSIEAVDNILDMSYISELLPRLAGRETPLNLFFEIKSNLRREQVEAMADGGVRWVQPGIESLDSDVLALIGKGAKASANIQLLKWCRQYGIRVSWNLITDFPGEEDAAYQRMAERAPLLTHLQPGSVVFLRFDRYSPYYKRAEEFGLKLRPSSMYGLVYPFDEEVLADLVYFFEDEGRTRGSRIDGRLPAHLAGRKGLAALRKQMDDWLILWRSGKRPVLVAVPEGNGARITDTRDLPCAGERLLDATAWAVLSRCDDAPPTTRFAEKTAQETGLAEADIATAVERLIADSLIIEIDRRYLALPLRQPMRDMPMLAEFPGGYLLPKPLRPARKAA